MRVIELRESLSKDDIFQLETSNGWLTDKGLVSSSEHREDIVNYYDGKVHGFSNNDEENTYLSALYEGWVAINTRHVGGVALRGTKNGLLSHKKDIAKIIQLLDVEVFIDVLSFSIPKTPIDISHEGGYISLWNNLVKIKIQKFDQFINPHKIINWIENKN